MRARLDLKIYASIIDIPNRKLGKSIKAITEEEKDAFQFIPRLFARHHLLWLECLQKVADGKIQRLMGLMPPGSAKSLLTSVCFPSYYLGRFPNSRVIVTGYASDLPKKFGRWARTVVSSEKYKRIFDATLSEESGAVDEWALTNGSEWFCKGINAGLTGNRADGVVWDDLIRGREDAESPTMRDKTWDAYMNDLLSRKVSDDAWEIGVNTRWHENDPAGRILPIDYNGESGWVKGQDGNDWYVVCLPAVCERDDDPLGRKPGELLWPEQFSMKTYAPIMQDARAWTSLYQQRPSPTSGSYFEKEWIKIHGEGTNTPTPDRDTLHLYGASDYATTERGGDYTVHIVAGVDEYHDIYILDIWRQRTTPDKWAEVFCDLVEEYHPIGWAQEKGQIVSGVGPFLHKMMLERQIYIARKDFPTKGDKAVRAQSIRGRMAQGKVYFPRANKHFPDVNRELLLFPAGTHDDIVDSLGLLGQILDVMIRGEPKRKDKEKPKVLSMDRDKCTVTLEDLFLDNEQHGNKSKNLRIW